MGITRGSGSFSGDTGGSERTGGDTPFQIERLTTGRKGPAACEAAEDADIPVGDGDCEGRAA